MRDVHVILITDNSRLILAHTVTVLSCQNGVEIRVSVPCRGLTFTLESWVMAQLELRKLKMLSTRTCRRKTEVAQMVRDRSSFRSDIVENKERRRAAHLK